MDMIDIGYNEPFTDVNGNTLVLEKAAKKDNVILTVYKKYPNLVIDVMEMFLVAAIIRIKTVHRVNINLKTDS